MKRIIEQNNELFLDRRISNIVPSRILDIFKYTGLYEDEYEVVIKYRHEYSHSNTTDSINQVAHKLTDKERELIKKYGYEL